MMIFAARFGIRRVLHIALYTKFLWVPLKGNFGFLDVEFYKAW